jgi:hypothetical protein
MGEAELRETWTTRELPILRAALSRIDGGDEYADLDELRVELGLTAGEVFAAVGALANASPLTSTSNFATECGRPEGLTASTNVRDASSEPGQPRRMWSRSSRLPSGSPQTRHTSLRRRGAPEPLRTR